MSNAKKDQRTAYFHLQHRFNLDYLLFKYCVVAEGYTENELVQKTAAVSVDKLKKVLNLTTAAGDM